MWTDSFTPATPESDFDSGARQRLVLENLVEVRYIARRISERLPPHVSFEDLIQAGVLGLLDAVDKFDPQKNVQFLSYARFRIRGSILDSLRQMDWGPRELRQQARKLEQAIRDLTGELSHAPSSAEIASRLGLPIEDFQRLVGDLNGLKLESLQLWPEEESGEQAVPVASRLEEDPLRMTICSEIRNRIRESLSELEGREGTVLGLYYLEELSMKKIGEMLGIGESRVSQIHASGLCNLRSLLSRFQFCSPPSESGRKWSSNCAKELALSV